MSAPEYLRVEVVERILRVRIDRPEKRNPLSRAVLDELRQVFAEYANDASLCAAVVTGTGDKSFAAGGDLKEFAAFRSEDDAAALFRDANEALGTIRWFPVPVVAALNGTAIGGGAELAVACDFRIAAAHATIGFVQGRLNISTGFGGGADLVQLVGPRTALSLLIGAQVLEASEAKRIGLVDEVATEGETLDACVERFLGRIRAHVPQVLRAFKAVASSGRRGLPRAAREDAERTSFVCTWTHPDHWQAAERLLDRMGRGIA
ncbi:MAG: enoyl-CoA hydratase/isomerase family protein [Burkholderiales bacterium]|nr:enoyl-CoA hydratase/isomerase family protein [Burkholderiales bacterium]